MLLELAGWITATTLVTMLVHIYALIGLWLLLGHLLGRSVRHRRIGHVELALATAGLVVVHLLEMLLWAFLIMHQTDLSRFGNALYYSMMSYTTVGYGDVVPHGDGRLIGSIEAVIGTLMTGLSTAWLLAFVSRALVSKSPA